MKRRALAFLAAGTVLALLVASGIAMAECASSVADRTCATPQPGCTAYTCVNFGFDCPNQITANKLTNFSYNVAYCTIITQASNCTQAEYYQCTAKHYLTSMGCTAQNLACTEDFFACGCP